MIFSDLFIADEKQIRSVLDYFIQIQSLSAKDQRYEALTGKCFSVRRSASRHISVTFYQLTFT